MDEAFVRERLSELRLKKGVSEYQMSLDLGHSKSYMQSISSGRAMPSWAEFFCMCEYLGVSPMDFFDETNDNPALSKEIHEGMLSLCDEDRQMLLGFMKRLQAGDVPR